MLGTLYGSPKTWPLLRRVLALAMAGDGHELLTLSDLYNQRDPQTGHYSNQAAANVAINCLDHPDVRSVSDVQAEVPEFMQASPLIGASLVWGGLPCVYWPVPAQSHPRLIHYASSPPILVIGTIHDPATPYPSAQEMADQLGSAVLLTYNGDGHTAYGRGSRCIDTAVDTYLVQGAAPATGTVCQPDAVPATPTPTP